MPEPVVQVGGASAPRVFTEEEHQAEVNRVAGTVRAEERAKLAPEIKQLRERAAVADTLENAGKSETEKLRARLTTLEGSNLDAALKIADMAVSSEIRVQAGLAGFADPNDARRLIDRAGIKYDEATQTVTGVKDALEALLGTKAYLKAPGRVTATDLNGGARIAAPAAVVLTADQKHVAHRMFSSLPEDKAEEAYVRGLKK